MAETKRATPLAERVCVAIADGLQLLLVGLALECLLFELTDVHVGLRLSAIAVLLIGVTRSTGWPVLLAVATSLTLRERRSLGPEFNLGLLAYCVVGVAVISYAYQAQAIRGKLGEALYRWLFQKNHLSTHSYSNLIEDKSALQIRAQPMSWTRLLVQKSVRYLAICGVSLLLLSQLPLTLLGRNAWLRQSLASEMTLWPGASLLTVALLVLLIFRELSWRKATASQSSLFLRSELMREHRKELTQFVRQAAKQKRVVEYNSKIDLTSNS